MPVKLSPAVVLSLFGTRAQVRGKQVFWSLGVWGWDGFRIIQVHYIHCALYFYYYYISCSSDHQALDPGGWGPLQDHSRVPP